MKYLKPFYESNQSLNDLFEDYFTYVSDLTKVTFSYDETKTNAFVYIKLKPIYSNIDNFDTMVNNMNINSEILNLSNDAISRIKEELNPNIIFINDLSVGYGHIGFNIFLEERKFYSKNDNIITLYKNEIINIMSIDLNDIEKIGISTDGLNHYFEINFKNQESFEKYDISYQRTFIKNYLEEINSKLNIEQEPLFKNLNINNGGEITRYINGNQISKKEWSLSFKLNKKFKYIIK